MGARYPFTWSWVLSGKGRMRPLQEGVDAARGAGLRRGVAGSSVGHLSRVSLGPGHSPLRFLGAAPEGGSGGQTATVGVPGQGGGRGVRPGGPALTARGAHSPRQGPRRPHQPGSAATRDPAPP